MPYKSDAQRRFFHTDTAKKAGITSSDIEEFDKASKGKKLPEKVQHKAYGGETNPKHETIKSMENNSTAGFKDGGEVKDKPTVGEENPWMTKLRDLLMSKQAPITAEQRELNEAMGADSPLQTSTGTVHMADGGDISDALSQLASPFKAIASPVQELGQNVAAGLPAALSMTPIPGYKALGTAMEGVQPSAASISTPVMPTTPQSNPLPINPITRTAQAIPQIPATEPNIYQGVTAEDRAALLQKLLAQKASGGNLAVSGLAGLGDAISRSFGHQNTNYQEGVRNTQNQNIEAQVGVIDTERQQKLQDLQANIMVQENDPNSAYSIGARNFASSMTGKPFPSGVTAAQIKSLFPDIVKIMDSQLSNASSRFKTTEEAQKAGADMGFWHQLGQKIMGTGEGFTKALEKTANVQSEGQSSGWRVVR